MSRFSTDFPPPLERVFHPLAAVRSWAGAPPPSEGGGASNPLAVSDQSVLAKGIEEVHNAVPIQISRCRVRLGNAARIPGGLDL